MSGFETKGIGKYRAFVERQGKNAVRNLILTREIHSECPERLMSVGPIIVEARVKYQQVYCPLYSKKLGELFWDPQVREDKNFRKISTARPISKWQTNAIHVEMDFMIYFDDQRKSIPTII